MSGRRNLRDASRRLAWNSNRGWLERVIGDLGGRSAIDSAREREGRLVPRSGRRPGSLPLLGRQGLVGRDLAEPGRPAARLRPRRRRSADRRRPVRPATQTMRPASLGRAAVRPGRSGRLRSGHPQRVRELPADPEEEVPGRLVDRRHRHGHRDRRRRRDRDPGRDRRQADITTRPAAAGLAGRLPAAADGDPGARGRPQRRPGARRPALLPDARARPGVPPQPTTACPSAATC